MKVIKAVLVIVLVAFAALGIYSFCSGSSPIHLPKKHDVTMVQLKKIIEPASDLIVTRYKYRDLGKYETYKDLWGSKVPFTTDKELFSYEGQISVGFDVNDIDIKDIDSENKKITIALPEIKVIANELDTGSFKIVDSSDSIFTSNNIDDYAALFDKLKKKQAKAAMSDKSFLKEAEKNAITLIKSLFAQNDATKDYKIIFEEK